MIPPAYSHLFLRILFSFFFCPVHPTLPQEIFFPKILSFWDLSSTLPVEKSQPPGLGFGDGSGRGRPTGKKENLFSGARQGEYFKGTKSQERKKNPKAQKRRTNYKEFLNNSMAAPNRTRVLRKIAQESSPESSAKSLSHKCFLAVPFLSRKHGNSRKARGCSQKLNQQKREPPRLGNSPS